ncbi:4-diphosphocytidyl-2C-methyl-D-erythritol kinase [Clostridium carboxidivorans P7]|uniref:4-diphosphocytidyl-2-C-methyl-D-erythritol kinase n=1 Tax=Clostridium carboxidivorans P7 TaxID=536227 RepID=C6PVG4_9CLOT|nr:4-(cytidine 5'-diphospho)-2-C-methyl-D-erythritol kinase [Clostridium carboxidivorans]AKN33279.1 4-diphosphocytidyl-2C-methyl-D-erythritol kinase [Clostridium carboxidivorans P7]EET86806.1 4-diphosphocytidyl-2C-methyl-D-erythritol kinase [Clostridium carboxidivorans P7]
MLIKAYAKVNLSLDVVGKREDGYHILEMIMQTIDLYDLINIKKTNKGINISCNKQYVPTDERNLAYKAAELFMKTYNICEGVDIYIKKYIPVAAGLAGGSTDAAAVLRAMRNMYRPDISDEKIMKLGLNIGADVPYCVVGGTALCEGIGEKVTKLNSFKNHILVVVKPAFGVSTKEVYKSLDINKIKRHPDTNLLISSIEANNLNTLARNMKNVLENVTLYKHVVLKDIKKEMINMGAQGALMSGSGPTIFAFFSDMLKAQLCYDKMKKKYRETFITRTI